MVLSFYSSVCCCLCNNDGRSVFGQGNIIQFAHFYEDRYSSGEQRENFRRHNQLFGDERTLGNDSSGYPMLKRSTSHDVHPNVRYVNLFYDNVIFMGLR